MLIGISGKATAGKDSVANLFCEIDPRFSKYSFALPIKEACNHIFGWDDRHSFGELKEVEDPFWGVSPRRAYQTLGTEWGRNLIHPDMWLKRAELEYKKRGYLIIPDVRFKNEVDWLINSGGVWVQVDRPDLKTISLSGHVSEHDLEGMVADIILHNDGSLSDLAFKAEETLQYIVDHYDELTNAQPAEGSTL